MENQKQDQQQKTLSKEVEVNVNLTDTLKNDNINYSNVCSLRPMKSVKKNRSLKPTTVNKIKSLKPVF